VVFLQRWPLTGLRFILAEPETGRHANETFFEVELDKLPAGKFISSQVYNVGPVWHGTDREFNAFDPPGNK